MRLVVTYQVQALRGECRQIRTPDEPRSDGESSREGEGIEPTLPRKASREVSGCPYRKPTQVGEVKIQRCAG